eukprot:Nk52_evm7s578 gene=Nk52_evmTU7s578
MKSHAEELSDYELQRLENIRERERVLAELQIHQAKEQFTELLSTKSSSANKRKAASERGLPSQEKIKQLKLKEKKKSRQQPTPPQRRSLRLQAVEADLSLNLPSDRDVGRSEAVRARLTLTKGRGLEGDEDRGRLPLQPLELDEIISEGGKAKEKENYPEIKKSDNWQKSESAASADYDNDDNSDSDHYEEEEKKRYQTFLTSLKGNLSDFDEQEKYPPPPPPPFSSSSSLFDYNSFCKSLGSLQINPERVAKVVPGRIFSLAVHPSRSRLLVAAGGKYGGVGVWDVSDTGPVEDEEEDNEEEDHYKKKKNKKQSQAKHHHDGVYLFDYHSRPVNCLTFNSFDTNKLISTSYDGTVRSLDLSSAASSSSSGNSKCCELIYGEPDESDNVYTSYHAQVDRSTFLVSMGAGGLVGLIDIRESNLKCAKRFRLFDKPAAKTISVHPRDSNLFLVANNKGAAGVFDLRTAPCSPAAKRAPTVRSAHVHLRRSARVKEEQREVDDNEDEDKDEKASWSTTTVMEPVVELKGHTKAISSAFFSPATGKYINTVSYDNKIRIYDYAKSSPDENKSERRSIYPTQAITHNNQTGRWLTTFKAEWHPQSDNVFFCGSMNHPRQIDCFEGISAGPSGGAAPDAAAVNFKQIAALKDEDCLSSVCSIVKCHPSQNVVVGGNSSGRVHVFM